MSLLFDKFYLSLQGKFMKTYENIKISKIIEVSICFTEYFVESAFKIIWIELLLETEMFTVCLTLIVWCNNQLNFENVKWYSVAHSILNNMMKLWSNIFGGVATKKIL